MAQPWLTSSDRKYGGGLVTDQKATSDASTLHTVAPAVQPRMAGFLSTGDPMFWFGALAFATVGLMAYSTLDAS